VRRYLGQLGGRETAETGSGPSQGGGRGVVRQGQGGHIGGTLDIEGKLYKFGSGGAGRQHIPYGDWRITPGSEGTWGRAHNALGIENQSIWDPVLHRYRSGIELHAASSDAAITEGCIAIAGNRWPEAKAQILAMIKKNGRAYVHIGPNGASISPSPHADDPGAEKVVGGSHAGSADSSGAGAGGSVRRMGEHLRSHFGHRGSDRLAGALAQEHKVTGNANVTVDFKNMPKGIKTQAAADGMFKTVEQRRTNQMPSPHDWAGL
jgi:hypothetical protein